MLEAELKFLNKQKEAAALIAEAEILEDAMRDLGKFCVNWKINSETGFRQPDVSCEPLCT